MLITLSKSIEIMELNLKEADRKMPPDVYASIAIFLALARAVQLVRKGGSWDPHALLPNEKPEDQ